MGLEEKLKRLIDAQDAQENALHQIPILLAQIEQLKKELQEARKAASYFVPPPTV